MSRSSRDIASSTAFDAGDSLFLFVLSLAGCLALWRLALVVLLLSGLWLALVG